MLYIISGASRSGKTIVAKRLAAQKGIPYLLLDWIMMGFTNGIPEYGIHHLLFPDDIAKRMWSFLEAMLESMIYTETDCVIEGEAVLPELIIELINKYPRQIKVCFIGYANIKINDKLKDIKSYSTKKNDWLSDKSDAYVIDHIQNMEEHSKLIEKSCKKMGLKYFDISKNFENVLDDILSYM